MKLKKINYSSALPIGVIVFVLQLINQIIITLAINIDPSLASTFGDIPAKVRIGLTPILFGIATYLSLLLMIYIYNSIAKRFPISWSVKK
ncbi:hypothetical protein D6829_02405 [Candidatus Pacearchaeota archaeon]|nr:MAG: hypothetical protein D6829_02405 [Candidatus Pacearchaeota archaeon]